MKLKKLKELIQEEVKLIQETVEADAPSELQDMKQAAEDLQTTYDSIVSQAQTHYSFDNVDSRLYDPTETSSQNSEDAYMIRLWVEFTDEDDVEEFIEVLEYTKLTHPLRLINTLKDGMDAIIDVIRYKTV